MTSHSLRAYWVLVLGLLVILIAGRAHGGGPMRVTSSGAPIVWSNPGSIPYNPDRGSLGVLGQDTARQFVADSFDEWSTISTTSVHFVDKGLLPVDVNKDNYVPYLNGSKPSVNPIIYDTDGKIIEDLYGTGSSQNILGFAAPIISGNRIVGGQSVMNGTFVGNSTEAELFRATLVHELGHYIGLDHTQINSFAENNGDSDDDQYLPTMYPTATDNDLWLITPNPDDIAWITELYPAVSPGLGAIEGTIFRSSGAAFNGANVIARKADDPFYTAISCVAGYRNPVGSGAYRIPGAPPGNYTVGVDQILPGFTAGSSVGPFDPPVTLPGPPEFYNGSSEGTSSSTDKPEDSLSFGVAAGKTTTGIDIKLNSGPAAESAIKEVEPNNTEANAQVIRGSRKITGVANSADVGSMHLPPLSGDPTNYEDDIEDLYFLDLGNAANITATLAPTDKTKDLDLICFLPNSLTIFALQRTFPSASNGGKESFGPLEIPFNGAYVGVSYDDRQGDGLTTYVLTLDVVRWPLGVAGATPSLLGPGSTTLVISGGGFVSGATVSFPNSGIVVKSVTYKGYFDLEVAVSVPRDEPTGYKEIRVQNSQGQVGRLVKGLQVVKMDEAKDWALYR